MFTVVLLSEWAKRRIGQWAELFEPFEKTGAIAFCDWNPRDTYESLSDAVPNIGAAIKGKKDWRVLVVGTGTEGLGGIHLADSSNPFDYVDNTSAPGHSSRSREQLNLEESKHPIIRLSHMLLGYPPMGAQSYSPDASYFDPLTRRRVYQSDFIFTNASVHSGAEGAKAEFVKSLSGKHDVQTHFMENSYSPEDQATHRKLTQHYQLRQSRPSDVVLVAPRDPQEINQTEVLRLAWEPALEGSPSRFVDRNDYPPSCRFALYDLHSEGHTGFELAEFRFWLSILSLSTADLPVSSFQADRVYKVDVELDEPTLGSTINAHLSTLAGARNRVDAELRKPIVSAVSEVAEILKQRNVLVSFDKLDGNGLVVPSSSYGLASDSPRLDTNVWTESLMHLELKVENFARKPRRVLTQAVSDAKRESERFPRPTKRLDSIERQELIDELRERTPGLTQPATMNIVNRTEFLNTIERNNEIVRSIMVQRMSRFTIIASSIFVLTAWLASLTPYLIQAGFIGKQEVFDSALVVLGTLGILAAISLLTLWLMKRKLIRAIKLFNEELRTHVGNVQAAAKDFGAFLSRLQTYMFGRSVLIHEDHLYNEQLIRERRLRIIKRRLEQRIEAEKEIIRSLGVPFRIQRDEESQALTNRLESIEEIRGLFMFPRGRELMTLNDSGKKITAPYDFIDKVIIDSLALREPVEA